MAPRPRVVIILLKAWIWSYMTFACIENVQGFLDSELLELAYLNVNYRGRHILEWWLFYWKHELEAKITWYLPVLEFPRIFGLWITGIHKEMSKNPWSWVMEFGL